MDVALRMGAPFLVERGIDPSEEGLGPALVMRLLLALPEKGGYFRPLAEQPQMAIAIWSTIRELRLAGVRAAALPASGFASREKYDELRTLLASYEQFLADTHRGDAATVLEEARQHLDWSPIQPADCWTEFPDLIWAPLQRRLIDAMPGERLMPRTLALPGAEIPRRLKPVLADRATPDPGQTMAFLMAPEGGHGPKAEGRSEESPGRPTEPDGRLRTKPSGQLSLFGPSPDPALQQPEPPLRPTAFGLRPALFHAGGPEAEIEEVFRRILSSGAPLDDVEVVCASPQYTTLVWEKACRYEWPVTIAGGLPAALTRPGRALLAFTEWIEDDFAAGLFRRLLQSGDVTLPEDAAASTGRAARLIVKAQAAWGRDTYRLALGRLARASRGRAERDDIPADEREALDRRAAEAERLGAWIDRLVALVPKPDGGGLIDMPALVRCAEAFVADVAARASALDAAAAMRLTSAIRELHALGSFRCGLGQGIRFLRERVEGLVVGADRPRPGHLHVSSFLQNARVSRRHTFVVGVEEGRVFPAAFEDPILLDPEREAASADLPRSADRTDEAVYHAACRLAAAPNEAGATLSLSYSCRDLREFRETYASWLVLQAFRAASRNRLANYRDLKSTLGEPASCLPSDAAGALGSGRWWLRGISAAGPAGRDAVLAQFPQLAAGAHADQMRLTSRFTEFDGYVPAAGRMLDPCRPSRVVSPTELEEAATCPFRYFLRRGLRIDAIESGERDRDVWLDPLIRGTLLHDLFAGFWRRCRAERRRPAAGNDDAWLRRQGEQTLRDLKLEMPPPSREVDDRESAEFMEDLELFARAEIAADPARTPIGFEVGFGRGDGTDVEALSQDDPIVLDLGGGLSVRVAGRIDRLDDLGSHRFEIVDYKTGRYFHQDWTGTFAGGRRLQHALYGLAAAELLRRTHPDAVVTGAQYYFPSAKGWQKRVRISAPPLASITGVLADLRDVVASGGFVHSQDRSGDCRFCDFGRACGRDAHEHAKRKGGETELGPHRRLAGHA
jgi:ATP-dependent helicase/nuclease subunit B